MKDTLNANSELIEEISALKQRIQDLEQSESELRKVSGAFSEYARRSDSIFNAINHSVCVIDPEGRIIKCNRSTEKLLNKSAEELNGHFCFEVVHGEPKPLPGCPFLRMKETKHRESMVIQSHGRWLDVTVDPILDDNQRIVAAVHIIVDITERKRAEEALKNSEDKYRSLFDNALEGIFQTTPEGKFISANPAQAKLFGYDSPRDLMERITDIGRQHYVNPEDRETYKNVLEAKGIVKGFEVQLLKKDGNPIWISLSARAIRNNEGAVIRYEGTVEDITSRKEAEEELRKNEDKLKSIFKAAPVGIGVVSDRIIMDANDRLCAMTGYKREELVGQSARIFYPDEKEFNFVGAEKYRQIAETGTGTVETRWRMKNGKVIQILLSSTPFDLKNMAQGVTFTALDISDRKLAEKGLQESETLQRTLLENLPAGVIIIDPVTRIIENVNNAAAAMFGIQTDHIVGHRCHAFLCPASEGACPVCDLGKEVDNSEREMICADGSRRPVLKSVKRVQIGGQDKLLECFVDITDRKETETALRESEERYRTAIEASHDGIAIVQNDVHVYVNQAFLNMFRYNALDEIIGRNNYCAIHPDDYERVVGYVQARQKGEYAPTRYEFKGIRRDGTPIDVEVSVNTIIYKGEEAILAYLRDNTDRKQAQENLQLNAQRTEVLLQLNQMTTASLKEITDFTLEEAVRLTKSTIGYLAFLNEDESVLTMHSWSRTAMAECAIAQKPIHYPVVQTGLWGEAVRQRKPVIINDYSAPNPWKKGYPEGHVQVLRHMNIPVFEESRIVLVAGVGNKEEEYNVADVQQLTLLMEGMWRLIEHKQAGEALRSSEEKYRTLFDSAGDAIFIHDEQAQILAANPAACERLGYTRTELISMTVTQVDSPEESPQASGRVARLMEHGHLSFETMHQRKNGSLVPTEVTARRITWDGQSAIMSICRDITERKQAGEALRESEAKYRSIFQNAVMGIFRTTPDGRYLSINPAGAKMYGYESEEEMMQSITDMAHQIYVHPEDRKHLHELLNSSGFAEAFESPHYTKEGSVIWVSINVRVIRDDSGAILYYETTSQDITDRKQAEEAITREREKLKTLSDNAPFGMVLIDQEDRFTYINRKFSELFGYDLSDIPDGRTWCRKAYPDAEYRHGVISAWREDLRSNKPGREKPNVFTVTCKDGTQKIIQFIFSVLVSGDSLMTCEDITELKHIESQLRQAHKMESIGTLAGGIAHDFNNILTALMGYASLLQIKMGRSDPLRAYVDEVLSASEKAVDLTQSLLAFSRQQSVTLVPLNMNNTIKTAKKLLRRLLTEDIELRTSLTDDEMIVMADKSQMDQILFNLVTNARDAMPRGGTLTIETAFATIDAPFIKVHGFGEPGEYVEINITDTGMGMNEITRSKIFDPFFTTKEVGKGTGLGLATVYGIVKTHKGYITVESTLNQGTTFHVYLPKVTTAVDEAEDTIIPVTGGKETILIAEDNEGVRRFMREALQGHGYIVREAIDGEDAVERFKEHRDIDLIIIDSVMPKKNGREAYEEIHRIDPHVKVVFTSGYTKDIVLDKGIEEKEFDFIGKPLSLNKLLQKVREVLDR